MKKNFSGSIILCLDVPLLCAIIVLVILAGCENDTTPSLFDPNATQRPNPIISSILPADSALAGVGELTITGQNFSAKPDENIVLFGTDPAVVLAASATELRVKTPNVVADSIAIKITVLGAELYTPAVWYKLNPAAVIFGDLKDPGRDAVKAFGIDVDLNGNVYVSTELNTIKKVSPDGKVTVVKSNASFIRANALKVGPGNILYATNVIARLRRITTIAPDGTESVFVSLPGNPQDLDFDANGNIWVTVDTDVYLVKPDKTAAKADSYPVTLAALRVYNGFVYVAGKNATTGEEKIWRSQIQGETLGAKEVILDVAAASWLTGGSVLSLTFSADGEMYLGTNHPDGMFVLREDGSHEVLYPGLFTPSIYALSWGEGNLLFAVQQLSNTSNLIKIDAGKKGAPYYGRR
ncbi:IPT/TIG domain-containing protein [candidate division KSB1 bacterium]|nr:IPT/TIG domain-containing protein [candidate division KSB1 bacterium]